MSRSVRDVTLDAIWRAAAAALAVGLTLSLLRRAGGRAAGLAAALPVSSLPALHLLWATRGAGSASAAARGALWGTALVALVVAAALAGGCMRRAPRRPLQATPRRPGGALWRTMVLAGLMSLLVAELATWVPAHWCGLVAATPLVLACALWDGWRQQGVGAMNPLLTGYLNGLMPKAACLAALAWGWQQGWGLAVWPAAAAVAALAWAGVQSITTPRSSAAARMRWRVRATSTSGCARARDTSSAL
ncbi:MAG: hypothetical protein U1F56_25625 [Rubrivivax sp.]